MAATFQDEIAEDELRDLLHREYGLTHLRVRRRGKTLTIESGPKTDAIKHARLKRDTVHLFLLQMPNRQQRWDATPVRATIPEIVDFLVHDAPWTLVPIDENPDGTSDPGY